MKRILSVITVILMLFTMIPSAAFAEAEQSQQTYSGTVTVEWVNPLYEHIPGNTSGNVQSVYEDYGIAAASDDVVYHTTYEAAGAEIRSKLAAHDETIVVRYQMDSSLADPENKWANIVAKGIFTSAIAETGNSYEGDAIGHAVKGYKASLNYSDNGTYYYMTLTYTFTYFHNAEQETELREAIDALKTELNIEDASDYEKVKAIYDYMCENITYDYDNLEDDTYLLKYSAYAALVNKTSVCEGYAVLFYRLAMEFGIDARVITGSSNGELHAWNIVKLGDKYYNLDATWDAPRSEYEYFLKGSGNFPNHTSNSEFTTSEFTSTYPISDEDYIVDEYISNIKNADNLTQEQWEEVYEKLAVALIFGKEFEDSENVPPQYAIWYLRINDCFDEFIQEETGMFNIKFEEIIALVDKYFTNYSDDDLRQWLNNYMHNDDSFSYNNENDSYTFHMDYGYGPSFKFVIVNKTENGFILVGKVDKSENETEWNDYQFVLTKTTEGYKISECSGYVIPECNSSSGEHDLNNLYTIEKASTCSEKGVKSIHCSNCNALISSTLLPTTEHKWDDGIVNIPATEEQDGSIFYTCEVCGSVKEKNIEWKSSDAVKSVSIDKELMSEGESATIAIEMEEGYEAEWIYLYKPITGNAVTVYLRENVDGLYIGKFDVTNQTESGIWKVKSLTYTNTKGEYKYVYNNNTYTGSYYDTMDFSAIDFEVIGTNADVTKPILKELYIDKSIVSAGESITITVEIEDETPANSIDLYYLTPSGNSKYISLKKATIENTILYQGTIKIDADSEIGIWQPRQLTIYDANMNGGRIYNSLIESRLQPSQDLSSLDFEVVESDQETILPGTEESYIVIFKDGYGNTLSTQRVNNGESAIEPEVPTNQLYLFAGWDIDFTNVQANLIINAKWTLDPNVVYDRESHIGIPFKITVYSQTDQNYTITCREDIEFDYVQSGLSYNFVEGEGMYYGKEYEIIVNTPGSYMFYVNGRYSTNTLEYKVKISEHIWDDDFTVDKEPSCTEEGSKAIHCSYCDAKKDVTVLPPTGHTEEKIPAVAATCETAGSTEGIKCSVCKEVLKAPETISAKGHDYTSKVTEPTCTEKGYTTYTCKNDSSHTYRAEEKPALGHDVKYKYNNNKTHTESCGRCDYSKTSDCTFDNGVITKEATENADGVMTFTCIVCGGTYTESIEYVSPIDENVYRIFGTDRYATSIKAADVLKADMGVEKFDNIVIASGMTFADALPGSYLAAKKKAPILLIGAGNASAISDYVNENLKAGGTVYVLGGTGVIHDEWISGMPNVIRLGGADRYETNLKILKAAGVSDASIVLVCTGANFADSLSASATGQPILLVGNSLNTAQKEYLNSIYSEQYCLIGGEGAVNSTVQSECEGFGNVIRLAGDDRYETSVKVAEMFFTGPYYAVLAYGLNFPDGLSAGPLAYNMKAPLILTATGREQKAVSYAASERIKYGYVIGGSGLISDNSVKAIFRMSSSDRILIK